MKLNLYERDGPITILISGRFIHWYKFIIMQSDKILIYNYFYNLQVLKNNHQILNEMEKI